MKDSPGYQDILAEGREEGRKILEEVLLDKIGKQFPGFELKADLDRVSDLEALRQLYFNLDQIADTDDLRAKLDELAPENASKEPRQNPQ